MRGRPPKKPAPEAVQTSNDDAEAEDTVLSPGRTRRGPRSAEIFSADGNESVDGEAAGRRNAHRAARQANAPTNEVVGTMQDLMQAIKAATVTDTDGDERVLSELFVELPLRQEYPDYYVAIAKPIALEHMDLAIRRRDYETLGDFQRDFKLLVANAQRYNEPGSEVWHDALALERIFDAKLDELMAKRGLTLASSVLVGRAWTVPSVWDRAALALVVEKLESHSTEQGRLLAADFLELPSRTEYPDYWTEITDPISLAEIRASLEAGEYDAGGITALAADVRRMVDNARAYNAESSQIYEDAETLGALFEALAGLPGAGASRKRLDSFVWEQDEFIAGDFVYLPNPNHSRRPLIGQVAQMWREGDSENVRFSVQWYVRPEHTRHAAGRKFMEREVFRTNHPLETYSASDVRGRCYVLFVRDYVRGGLENVDPNDVFVCESRYNEQTATMAKIRNWMACQPRGVRYIDPPLRPYETPLVPNMVPSVFAGTAAEASGILTSSSPAFDAGLGPGYDEPPVKRKRGRPPRPRDAFGNIIRQMGPGGALRAPVSTTAAGSVAGGSSMPPSGATTPMSAMTPPPGSRAASVLGGRPMRAAAAAAASALAAAAAGVLPGQRPRPGSSPLTLPPGAGGPAAAGATFASSVGSLIQAAGPDRGAFLPVLGAGGVQIPPAAAYASLLAGVPQPPPKLYSSAPASDLGLPEAISEHFSVPAAANGDDERVIHWYAAPPVDIVPQCPQPVHSLEYLGWKQRQAASGGLPGASVVTAASATTNGIRNASAPQLGHLVPGDAPNGLARELVRAAEMWFDMAQNMSVRVRSGTVA